MTELVRERARAVPSFACMKTLAVCCWVALAGCGAAPTNETVETTGASFVSSAGAADAVGRTECARTQACGAVASRGIYRGADYCETDLRTKIDDDLLGAGACKWIDRGRLEACLDAIRSESCATMGIDERPPPPCRRAWLCR